MENDSSGERLTMWQRSALKQVRRRAGREGAEPLAPEDWEALWKLNHGYGMRVMHKVFRALPHGPRCAMCSAPFEGAGSLLTKPLGYRPSRKNPTICSTCVEASPPGGMTMDIGVLFIDIRGFTSSSEGADPAEVAGTLRRFYGCAEKILFPEALIDKLIGDEVMALYLPFAFDGDSDRLKRTLVDHARRLLGEIGYGSADGPFVEAGIGVDYGAAFVGNIGDRAVYDFTAIGDVVNTASRLQGAALGGEIVLSDRVAGALDENLSGNRVDLELKGKASPQVAYRISP